jgi:hypothetical protein
MYQIAKSATKQYAINTANMFHNTTGSTLAEKQLHVLQILQLAQLTSQEGNSLSKLKGKGNQALSQFIGRRLS